MFWEFLTRLFNIIVNFTDIIHINPFENVSMEADSDLDSKDSEDSDLEEEEEENSDLEEEDEEDSDLEEEENSWEDEEKENSDLEEEEEEEEEEDVSSEYSSIISYDLGEEDLQKEDLQNKKQKIKFVSLEGNIAAGKTTLIRRLKEKYQDREDILFLEEPIDIWNIIQDKNGKTILQYFYKDLAKYAFSFQVLAYTTRLQLMKDTIANASPKVKVVVMERSLEADTNIFAKMLYEEGIMNTIEYQVYSLMTENNWEDYGVDGIIWLHTDPDECYSRVRIRNREGEEGLDLGYLRKCHQYHLEWLGANLGFVCNIGESESEGDSSSLELDLEKIDNYLF